MKFVGPAQLPLQRRALFSHRVARTCPFSGRWLGFRRALCQRNIMRRKGAGRGCHDNGSGRRLSPDMTAAFAIAQKVVSPGGRRRSQDIAQSRNRARSPNALLSSCCSELASRWCRSVWFSTVMLATSWRACCLFLLFASAQSSLLPPGALVCARVFRKPVRCKCYGLRICRRQGCAI